MIRMPYTISRDSWKDNNEGAQRQVVIITKPSAIFNKMKEDKRMEQKYEKGTPDLRKNRICRNTHMSLSN